MATESPRRRPYEVLIVEDDANDAELFLRVLRTAQADVDTEMNPQAVSDSSQAAARIQEHKFDAIFLDFNMPPPDGLELTRLARASQVNRSTTIVMISGAEDRGVMSRAFQAGVNLFLFKPVDRKRLVRLLQVSSAPIDRERRKAQRVKVKCKVLIEAKDGPFEVETEDLSLSGMMVRSSRALAVGSVVNASLALVPALDPIRTTARVVRSVGNDLLAFQFESLSTTDRNKLSEYLVPLIVAYTEANHGRVDSGDRSV